MHAVLAGEPISPELVLVAPPEEAEAARLALPDVYEFYAWIDDLRAIVEPIDIEAERVVEDDRRGEIIFATAVCLNAIAPLVLLIVRQLVG